MTKKILSAITFLCITNGYSLRSMDDPNKPKSKNFHVVYSHGFGEYGKMTNDYDFLGNSNSAPIYPDAPGNLSQGVFYTKPAVHTLANHLLDKVNKGETAIVLVGRSCGGGTATNCVTQLIHYDPVYFQGSNIKSKDDADKITAAINNGAFIQTAPFYGLRKANAIAIPSRVLAGTTIALGTGLACYYGSNSLSDKISPEVTKVGLLTAGLATYTLFGNFIKNLYASAITYLVVPRLTNGHFDPSHPEPIDEVERLRGNLSCPILLHFNKDDKVLENPDEDTIKVYDALKNDKTHIIITDDSWHNGYSRQLKAELINFQQEHLQGKERKEQTTKPSTDELRKQIYPKNITSILSRNKMLTAGGIGITTFAGIRAAQHILEKE